MKGAPLFILATIISVTGFSQRSLGPLSVEKIMRDPKWIGTSPSNIQWSNDGKYLFFTWNPDKAASDSLYYITNENNVPIKADNEMKERMLTAENVNYNQAHTAYTYGKNGDVFFVDQNGKVKRITETVDLETNPFFSFSEKKVVYTKDRNLFAWDILTGETTQITNFQKGEKPATADALQVGRRRQPKTIDDKKETLNPQQKWLANDQLELFDVLRQRKQKNELTDSIRKLMPKEKQLHTIYVGDKNVFNINLSPDGKYVSYGLYKEPSDIKNTIVPNYVTESGFTADIPGREKVGKSQASYEFFIFDPARDTVIKVNVDQIPGITDPPDYLKYYPAKDSAKRQFASRGVLINGPYWSQKGNNAVVDIYSQDNKDRWVMMLDFSTGKLHLLDRQRDEAWVGGPGIQNDLGWIDENTFWYQSETSGYSHLYSINVTDGKKQQITSGNYEVQHARLSRNKKYFYIISNEVNPGEQQFYRLSVDGREKERITTMTGANEITISPDEKEIAIRYSYSNKPWELYLQLNKPGTTAKQITKLAQSEEYNSYPWRDPEIITFTARDGATVRARLYRPSIQNDAKPAVIFVHGAGYLQNAHKWWSYYFREFMFNNLLADNGYTVLDIDYRGSAGYGRDWRTAIYRHMGGKDLDDQVDGSKYLVEKFGINPKHIGLYGGSYGGFITLMAMFTTPDVFAAGAGLRSVTDWAHYDHEYTSNILNEPFNDSIAYKQSSPIYFASGLKGHLLMCHGMVDENVHFQDIVRLSQRLIELGKDNWELAVFPVEDHGFIEPSSWTDEYKRIYKLFQTYLK